MKPKIIPFIKPTRQTETGSVFEPTFQTSLHFRRRLLWSFAAPVIHPDSGDLRGEFGASVG
jgi:hypothetical protein